MILPMKRWPAISLGAGIVAVAVVVWFTSCRPTPTPIPPKEQKSIDSLDATKPAFDSSHTQAAHSVTTIITKIVHDSAALAIVRRDAEESRHLADSLAAAASHAADSASAWHAAYDQRSREAADLRVDRDTLSRDLAAAKDTLIRVGRQLRDDSLRIASITVLNAGLARDLRAADPPCRVLPFVKCPSRKVVAVMAAGTGILATIEYDRRKP